jgi:hypothetical protein
MLKNTYIKLEDKVKDHMNSDITFLDGKNYLIINNKNQDFLLTINPNAKYAIQLKEGQTFSDFKETMNLGNDYHFFDNYDTQLRDESSLIQNYVGFRLILKKKEVNQIDPTQQIENIPKEKEQIDLINEKKQGDPQATQSLPTTTSSKSDINEIEKNLLEKGLTFKSLKIDRNNIPKKDNLLIKIIQTIWSLLLGLLIKIIQTIWSLLLG